MQDLAIKSAALVAKSSELSLKLFQAQTDLRAMNTSSEEKDRELGEKRQAAEDCTLLFTLLRNVLLTHLLATVRFVSSPGRVETARLNQVAKRWFEQQDAAKKAADPVVANEAMELLDAADPILEDLEAELRVKEVSLETTATISPAILRAFESRAEEVSPELQFILYFLKKKLAYTLRSSPYHRF